MTATVVPLAHRVPPLRDAADAFVVPATQGALALIFDTPVPDVPLRLVPPADPWGWADEESEPLTPRDQLPDPRPWSARFAQALIEVLAGSRPPAQLAPLATLDVLERMERSAGRLGDRLGSTRAAVSPANPRLVSVHVSEPSPSVAEVCAVVDTTRRCRALALRIEGRGGRWRCTSLQLG